MNGVALQMERDWVSELTLPQNFASSVDSGDAEKRLPCSLASV
jgi:hypothetical protein